MQQFLQDLYKQRMKFLDGLDANEDDINLDIFEDFYPDKAHFVFELLQNAEDVEAKTATFKLEKNGCWFEHDGTRSFTEADVRAITGIHNSTKSKEPDRIGKFGIGFKSVSIYTDTPIIYSETVAFKISRKVLPEPVDDIACEDSRTRFWLPFNNPKKAPHEAFSEIEEGLNQLAETTLLFLPNIESISWQIEGGASGELLRIQHANSHFEILKQIGGKTTTSAHFLRFDAPVKGLEKQRVAIAFPLDFLPDIHHFDEKEPLAKQLKIVPAKPGLVAVFFPAEKETSGLRFHLHAPFVPELSRASIKETPANAPLFEQLAELTASSLHHIRDLGLLTGDFLSVLPNPQDAVPPRYEKIRSSIIAAMKTEPLTPTYDKSHAPAQNLIQSKAVLKDLLTEDDIEFLVEYEETPPKWAISATQKNSNTDRFLTALEIEEWDVDTFSDLLEEKLNTTPWKEPDPEFLAWLGKKPVDWHQQFYALLYRELGQDGNLYSLEKTQIIRLSNGQYSLGSECFFPGDAFLWDDLLPRIDPAVYTSGKSNSKQQADAKRFLQEMGVREVGEVEQVEAILKQRYTEEAEIPDTKTYKQDFKRFVALVEKEESNKSLFEDYYIFQSEEGQWCTPSCIFLDAPFLDTGLSSYYEALGENVEDYALNDFYKDCGIPVSKVAKFAELVGGRTKLEVKETRIWENPQSSYLRAVPGERATSPINRDYIIENLEELLATPDLSISKLVWETMRSLQLPQYQYDYPRQRNPLRAVFQKNDSNGARYADSQLVHILKNSEWIPQEDRFVTPANASQELLPEGFAFDAGWPWIKALKFGENIKNQKIAEQIEETKASEQYERKQDAAREFGFENAEEAEFFASLPKEERERVRTEYRNRQKPVFPERRTANPERRTEKVAERYNDSEPVSYEKRERSVRTTSPTVSSKEWLKGLYTNENEQLICQMCEEEMPFKLRDSNEYYFEAVQVADSHFHREDHAGYLALCPLCAAKYKNLVKSDDSARNEFLTAISSAEDAEQALPVNLGDNHSATIRFVETHLIDLKSIIDQEQADEDSPNTLAEVV